MARNFGKAWDDPSLMSASSTVGKTVRYGEEGGGGTTCQGGSLTGQWLTVAPPVLQLHDELSLRTLNGVDLDGLAPSAFVTIVWSAKT